MSNFDSKTPAGQASGLGSARSGVKHYIHQLSSAIALVVLVPWFLFSIVTAMGQGFDAGRAFVGQTHNAILLVVFFGAMLYHMRLGMQTIIEDYLPRAGIRMACLLASTFATLIAFVAVILSILKIWMGA